MPFNKKYHIIENAPSQLDWEEYRSKSLMEYQLILENCSDDETVFQKFFEENPSFLPGGLELFGNSGHYPYMDALISQPEIGGVFRRIPDYVWLANDSLTFAPVFIEIEKPSKKMFNLNNTVTAPFSQAYGQIQEWKYILNQPINIQIMYDYFNLPIDMRKKTFKPQFLLVYGRRDEYDGNQWRTGIRASYKTDDIDIMSYDRLKPISDYRQFVSCKLSHGTYNVLNIPPTFRYRADCAEELVSMNGFYQKIDSMKYTSEERKNFLKDRYEYWCRFGQMDSKGIICGHEGE